MKLPSAHQYRFAENPQVHMQRSAFDRRHSNSFTFYSGYIVPFFLEHVAYPGDTINLEADIFCRMNTPYFPIMTNVYMMVHFWAVPYRLLQLHWPNLQGERATPSTTTQYLTPICTIPSGGYAVHSLQDYLQLPVVETVAGDRAGLVHNTYPLRAYNYIWNYAYRDENLQDPVWFEDDDGPDDPADFVLLKRGKRPDYFTSGLPWPQKGDPVGISLAGNAQVKGLYHITAGVTQAISGVSPAGGTPSPASVSINANNASGGIYMSSVSPVGTAQATAFNSTNLNVYADLSTASAITINAFRSAFLTQELLETDARGGTRYPEMIQAHWGVSNPDARMQYPEWLGGKVTPLDITSVPQTSNTPVSGTPQGNLAAFGTISSMRNGFVKSFTEHCVVLGFLCVYADLTYSQGLDRHYARRTRYDYYMPVLANLGEQAILNQEIYALGTAGGTWDATTFAYQERWAEDRYMPNRVGGLFRPGVANSLASWNLSQFFGSGPTLNASFIVEAPPFSRVVVVTSEPDFKADCYIKMTHVRVMPVRSVPVRLGGRRMF